MRWLRVDRRRAGGRGRPGSRAGETEADHPVPDRLHDPALRAVPARAGPDRHQGGRLSVRRLGHDARGGSGKRCRCSPPTRRPSGRRSSARSCRDLGLEPLLMFSGLSPEDLEALEVTRAPDPGGGGGRRPGADVRHTPGGRPQALGRTFKELGPLARDHGVLIVVKQHGGETGTGAACAEIIREVDDDGDQGQLRRRQRDGLPRTSTRCRTSRLRRRGPQLLHQGPPQLPAQGPGLRPRLRRDRPLPAAGPGGLHRPDMPLCCENIFAPLLPRPASADGVDALARRAASSSRS